MFFPFVHSRFFYINSLIFLPLHHWRLTDITFWPFFKAMDQSDYVTRFLLYRNFSLWNSISMQNEMSIVIKLLFFKEYFFYDYKLVVIVFLYNEEFKKKIFLGNSVLQFNNFFLCIILGNFSKNFFSCVIFIFSEESHMQS